MRRAAFEALRASPLLEHTDAVICSHPAALCEVWLPFNKSLLLLVTTNLELARENPQRWRQWLRTIVAMSSAPRVVIAANSRYDQAYVEHFTGVLTLYLPSLADYVGARYSPQRGRAVLFTRPHHRLARMLLAEVRGAAPKLNVKSIDELYGGNAAAGGYSLAQLASHPAVVLVPYTKSTMTFFELYRMAVPIFAPSLELLTKWELHSRVMSERVYWRYAPSPLRTPASPNPNALNNKASLAHWLKLCDTFAWPHVQYFDSASDLADKLRTTDLAAVSASMSTHNHELRLSVHAKWQAVITTLFEGQPPGSWPTDASPGAYDRALQSRFGLALPTEEPDCNRQSAPELGRWA